MIELSNISSSEVRFEIFHLNNDESLDHLFASFMAFLAVKSESYIWNFSPPRVEKTGLGLCGVLEFGDLYDEEWLLLDFLKEFTMSNTVAARIYDADGEFVLVEAADVLPDWVTPKAVERKVWIYKGNILLLDEKTSADSITIQKLSKFEKSVDSRRINTELLQKLKLVREDCAVHTANLYLPQRSAYILSKNPQLISACVAAFYTRDPIDLRGCRTLNDFPRKTFTATQIPLNRCSLAQLLSQTFVPDKRTGYLPLPIKDDPFFLPYTLGIKITVGLNILLLSAKKSSSSFDGSAFSNFLEKLENNGYFEGELEKSMRWTELYDRARSFFLTSNDDKESNDSFRFQASFMIKELSESFSGLKDLPEHVSNFSDFPPESSIDWLCLDPKAFDQMLNERYNWDKKKSAQNEEENYADQLADMNKKMKNFVKTTSDFEGVNISHNTEIELDPAKFSKALDSLLGKQDATDSDDYLDSDDLDDLDSDDETGNYYAEMDNELAGSKVMQGFFRKPVESGDANKEQKEFDEQGELDIDLNLVSGLMKSYESQLGLTGPAGNILASLGVALPDNDETANNEN
ncbi:unnamed protein product [Oikopleura dioica]|uniref:Uncharacterized protein n=1 Tax=Oikopleura dioica TaxID=34765 RepID=E4WS72_OIKDI|nr:unnamed protein product [Oikopleura dioica]